MTLAHSSNWEKKILRHHSHRKHHHPLRNVPKHRTTISNIARLPFAKSETFSGLSPRREKPPSLTPRTLASSKAETPPPEMKERFVVISRSVQRLDRNSAKGRLHHPHLVENPPTSDDDSAGTYAPPPTPSPDSVFPPLHLPSLSHKHYTTSTKGKGEVG